MAFARVGSLGSTTEKTSDTSITLTVSATCEAGNLAAVFACMDNLGTAEAETSQLSISDSSGGTNSWTKLGELTMSSGSAADGITVAMWVSKLAAALTSGSSTITITSTGSVTAKAMAAEEFTMDAAATVGFDGVLGTDYQVDAAAVSDPASMSLSGLASREYLLLHVNGEERGATRTADADYTEMFDAVETAGGGAATNVSLWAAYRIATLTGDTIDMASATDGDYAQIVAAIYEDAGGGTSETPPPGGATAGGVGPAATAAAAVGGGTGGGTSPGPQASVAQGGATAGGVGAAAVVTVTAGGATAGGQLTDPLEGGTSETPTPGGALAGGNSPTAAVPGAVGAGTAGGNPPAAAAVLTIQGSTAGGVGAAAIVTVTAGGGEAGGQLTDPLAVAVTGFFDQPTPSGGADGGTPTSSGYDQPTPTLVRV